MQKALLLYDVYAAPQSELCSINAGVKWYSDKVKEQLDNGVPIQDITIQMPSR